MTGSEASLFSFYDNIMLMFVVALFVFGLIFGSFINALVWRLHEQSTGSKIKKRKLSIINGRSMCPNCKHELAVTDLIPIFSWVSLRGKCRYCQKSISFQYPLVELTTALLFIASYFWWPMDLKGLQVALFLIWLVILVGLIALAVYDVLWGLLPNRIIYPLTGLGFIYALISVLASNSPLRSLLDELLAVVIGGGIFYLLFQVSNGKWIGGGDVRLGWLLGLIVGTAIHSILFIFLGSLLGSLVSIPLLASNRLKRTSTIPFGPFLIAGAYITVLFGTEIMNWYTHTVLHI